MSKNNFSDEELIEYANLVKVQSHQQDSVSNRLNELDDKMDDLGDINDKNADDLAMLLTLAEDLEQGLNVDFSEADVDDAMTITQEESMRIEALVEEFEDLKFVEFSDDWNSFVNNNFEYANEFGINLTKDPFEDLLTESERQAIIDRIENEYDLKMTPMNLDKYDYLVAALSGVLCGLIDVFFIGEPLDAKKLRSSLNNKKKHEKLRNSLRDQGLSKKEIDTTLQGVISNDREEVRNLQDSVLNSRVEKSIDKIVYKFSSFIYDYDKKHGKLVANQNKKFDNIAGAIGYLEKRFKVPYDARYAKDLGLSNSDVNLTPRNHHLKSLGHMPDIFGLFFSILDQFRHSTTVINNGKIQTHITPKFEEVNGKKNFELQGNTFIAKILCGVVNWFGHLMSDLVGSSGTRGHENKKGAGIPMPFYGLTQLMSNNIPTSKSDVPTTFAKIAEQVYIKGYDARFGATLAIPVVLNELIVRLFWTIKQVFYNKQELKEILKIHNSREMNRLLLVAHGSLCTVDGIDAFIRSGGGQNLVVMLSRCNIAGWTRFGLMAFKETVTIYKEHSNLKKLEKDLNTEWDRIFDDYL